MSEEVKEKSLYEAIKENDQETIDKLNKKAEAGEVIRII